MSIIDIGVLIFCQLRKHVNSFVGFGCMLFLDQQYCIITQFASSDQANLVLNLFQIILCIDHATNTLASAFLVMVVPPGGIYCITRPIYNLVSFHGSQLSGYTEAQI